TCAWLRPAVDQDVGHAEADLPPFADELRSRGVDAPQAGLAKTPEVVVAMHRMKLHWSGQAVQIAQTVAGVDSLESVGGSRRRPTRNREPHFHRALSDVGYGLVESQAEPGALLIH